MLSFAAEQEDVILDLFKYAQFKPSRKGDRATNMAFRKANVGSGSST